MWSHKLPFRVVDEKKHQKAPLWEHEFSQYNPEDEFNFEYADCDLDVFDDMFEFKDTNAIVPLTVIEDPPANLNNLNIGVQCARGRNSKLVQLAYVSPITSVPYHIAAPLVVHPAVLEIVCVAREKGPATYVPVVVPAGENKPPFNCVQMPFQDNLIVSEDYLPCRNGSVSIAPEFGDDRCLLTIDAEKGSIMFSNQISIKLPNSFPSEFSCTRIECQFNEQTRNLILFDLLCLKKENMCVKKFEERLQSLKTIFDAVGKYLMKNGIVCRVANYRSECEIESVIDHFSGNDKFEGIRCMDDKSCYTCFFLNPVNFFIPEPGRMILKLMVGARVHGISALYAAANQVAPVKYLNVNSIPVLLEFLGCQKLISPPGLIVGKIYRFAYTHSSRNLIVDRVTKEIFPTTVASVYKRLSAVRQKEWLVPVLQCVSFPNVFTGEVSIGVVPVWNHRPLKSNVGIKQMSDLSNKGLMSPAQMISMIKAINEDRDGDDFIRLAKKKRVIRSKRPSLCDDEFKLKDNG